MTKSKLPIAAYLTATMVIGLSAILLIWDGPRQQLEVIVEENSVLSPFLFIFAMFLSTVIAPVTALPLVPVMAPIFGWLPTFLYTLIGWVTGAIVAFLLARHFGRPILSRFLSLESLDRYRTYVSERVEFWYVVLLRMAVPVDTLSYALGFFSRISLWRYSLATTLGITPFCFIFSYGGEVWRERNYDVLLALVIVSLILFLTAAYFFYKRVKN